MLGALEDLAGSSVVDDGLGVFAAAAAEENEAKEGAFPGFLPAPSDIAVFTPGKLKDGFVEGGGVDDVFSGFGWGGGGAGAGWVSAAPVPTSRSGWVPDAQKTESMVAQTLSV